jgi:hypothetical protein
MILLVSAWRWRRRQPIASVWIALGALALIGVGAHEAVSDPWTLLAVPLTAAAFLGCLRSAVRGPRDKFFENMRWAQRGGRTREKPRSLAVTRLWFLFGAVIVGFGGGLAVAAAIPPGPTVDVQVVRLAYGGDPLLGTRPNLFGLGVRQARCSGGATAYTLTVLGATYERSCAATSGTSTSAVIVARSAGQSYTLTIRAMQKRAGRNPRLGSAHKVTVQIPPADSKDWHALT